LSSSGQGFLIFGYEFHNLGDLCTTDVQSLEILLSNLLDVPPKSPQPPFIKGGQGGISGRRVAPVQSFLVAALPRCDLRG
jgi:hypothetical protein